MGFLIDRGLQVGTSYSNSSPVVVPQRLGTYNRRSLATPYGLYGKTVMHSFLKANSTKHYVLYKAFFGKEEVRFGCKSDQSRFRRHEMAIHVRRNNSEKVECPTAN